MVSKLVESIVLKHIKEHAKKDDLLPEYQSAYTENYFCETALIKLENYVLWSMEKQQCVLVFVIDLSAAFDTVDHSVMLSVLENKCGSTRSPLHWMDSNLRPKGFCTHYSEFKQTNFHSLKDHASALCCSQFTAVH